MAFGPKMRMLGSSIAELNCVNPAVNTSLCVTRKAPCLTSIMLTEPWGSMLPVVRCSC